jgi:2-polyprenyl-3-methyl-5-hydroxy-6-metoxy-1,4-benzoquinol methylase
MILAERKMVQQDKVWDFFQNEGLELRKFPVARQRFMLRHLHAGQSVLDIGVGAGILERLALEKGIKIHALDPSTKAIERLRKELGLGGRARSGYVQEIPFEDKSFDVVVMSEVLEHLDNESLRKGLAEVKRVLKPKGMLLTTTPHQEDLGANTVVCPDCGHVFHKVGHLQSFDRQRMAALMHDAGFRVERLYITTFVDWRRRGVGNFLKSLVRKILARMGEGIADPHLVVHAFKPSGGP